MPRDIQRMTKKEQKKNITKKQDELTKNRKSHKDSDSDNDYDDYDEEEEEENMDVHEYRKFLSKIFPSKYINKKIQKGEEIKKFLKNLPEENDEDTDSSSEEEEEYKMKNKKNNKNTTKSSKSKAKNGKSKKVVEEDTDDDEKEEESKERPNSKFNIIFTVGKSLDQDEDDWEDYDDDDDDDDSDYETEDEDEDVSTDSDDSEDEDSEDEDTDEDDEESNEDEELIVKKSKFNKNNKDKDNKDKDKNKKSIKNTKIKCQDETEIVTPTNESVSSNTEIMLTIKDILHNSTNVENKSQLEKDEYLLKGLKEIEEKNKGNKMVSECIHVVEKELSISKHKQEKKVQKTKEKHERIFRRIIADKNTMNDFTFFEKLNTGEQKKIIKEVREINKIIRVEKPYRITLLESDIPPNFKAAAMKKLGLLRYMEPGSGEYYKIKNWIDTFMRVPFGKTNNLPVNISDGVEKCHEFMESSKKILDDAVYGLNDAKIQIMQMLGQLVTNPSAIGTAIAIHGPPGTGKTSLVKEGISKILNRPFAFIALGGATDSSFLEGHSYTYEGSIWGKIVQILIDSKCMNPVIYFDELDKISDTPKGEEIAGILTHLTDTTQNSQFHDKYFAEIDFDLSKCLFIFSYNDETKINPILKDRMYRIKTKGYDKKQKTVIGNSYLLPKIREQVKFTDSDIVILEETIHHIIETYCNKEDGVRNLKRCLEIVYTKLNLFRLMRPGSNLFEEDMSLTVEFPFTVTKDIVDKMIKTDKDVNMSLYSMYM